MQKRNLKYMVLGSSSFAGGAFIDLALRHGVRVIGISRSKNTRVAAAITLRPSAIPAIEALKPKALSEAPPAKKPSPLRAFFEPVSQATQRYSRPSLLPTSNFTLLLALILFRSLAIPDKAWAAIT